ncbi:DNA-binding response regulator [Paenibacillus psychroresistens]|uniref:DNA-binding response regulator n=1 Tax=Paenibacillus psychroresistens TaxID=1778678 RepID=A0A6B8RV54_9BACL|nr:response regulator transcription factor [Paenibacillus psychroresistens]QGQ99742.1 DNA-binding response regulator [Paenibacillus psychroresistens]
MYKVFIVEDEPFIIEGLYDIIDWASFGLEIVGHAENGKEALDALQLKPVDILITDISMPIMNGLELIAAARALRPELKVIILSGYNEFNYLKEGMKLGIENYLLKPINLVELQSTLANTIEKLNEYKVENAWNKYDSRIIQDNILYRFMTGQIAGNEFMERVHFLQLDFDKPYILVAIIRSERFIPGLFDYVVSETEEDRSIIPFRDMDGDIVLIFTLSEMSQGHEDAAAKLLKLKEQLLDHEPLRYSLGTIESLPEQAALSYTHAKKAQEYFLIYRDKAIMDYQELPIVQGIHHGLPVDWPEYSKLIIAKEKYLLFARIDKDFQRIQTIEGMTPTYIQSIAIEMMIRFKIKLKEITNRDQADLYEKGFEQVMNAFGIYELVSAIKEVAGLTVDLLIRDVKSPVIQQVLKDIEELYADEISLKTLSGKYNIHPVYLGQLFHKETSESFAEYINKYRIEQAKEMLKSTHFKVHEIARKVGYWETGYFYKQFKKYVGISPTDYKGLL